MCSVHHLPSGFSLKHFLPHLSLLIHHLESLSSEERSQKTLFSPPEAGQLLTHSLSAMEKMNKWGSGLACVVYMYICIHHVLIQDLSGYYDNKRWKRYPRRYFHLLVHHLWGEHPPCTTGEIYNETLFLVQHETSNLCHRWMLKISINVNPLPLYSEWPRLSFSYTVL